MKLISPDKLSKEGNKEFRRLYRNEHGINLTPDEADEMAILLLRRMVCVFESEL